MKTIILYTDHSNLNNVEIEVGSKFRHDADHMYQCKDILIYRVSKN